MDWEKRLCNSYAQALLLTLIGWSLFHLVPFQGTGVLFVLFGLSCLIMVPFLALFETTVTKLRWSLGLVTQLIGSTCGALAAVASVEFFHHSQYSGYLFFSAHALMFVFIIYNNTPPETLPSTAKTGEVEVTSSPTPVEWETIHPRCI